MNWYKMYKSANNASAIDQIIATGYGWISADGRVIPTKMYDHFEALVNEPKYTQQIQELIHARDTYEDAQAEYSNNIPEGEHPEWHVFEMGYGGELENTKRDLRSKIMREVYDDGWVRIGIMDSSLTVYAEGGSAGIKAKMPLLNEIANVMSKSKGVRYRVLAEAN